MSRKTTARALVTFLLAAACAPGSLALERIYLVRHAEKAEAWPEGRDLDALWPLSAAGAHRAEVLAAELAAEGVAAIYASPTTRALATAMPLSAVTGALVLVEKSVGGASGTAKFLDGLARRHARDTAVLIVGHSNTLPDMLVHLGARPECHERLGIVKTPAGLRVEGHSGLWVVDLGGSGCARIARRNAGPEGP